MSKKSKFYDIVPKENKSIRNIPIPEKGNGGGEEELIESDALHKDMEFARKHRHSAHVVPKKTSGEGEDPKGSVKKHDHKESSSVEIKKLERPITNVEEYNEDEYIEIIDHKTSDDEVTEEVHLLGENKEEIEKTKIPALAETENEDFDDYAKSSLGKGKGGGFASVIAGFFKGSYRLPIFIFIILAICFFALNMFASATVILKTEDLKVSLDSGYKFDAGDGEVIQSTSTDSVTVPATGTITVNKKSIGTVVIFNNTSASQKLTKGTRLQASNGLIYLLDKAVTVPAKKTVAKKAVPGSVTTTFTAEASGEKYNSGPKDFTFPGFKGTAKFDTIYGRSKGSITGGYSGEVPNISQKDLTSDVADATAKMKGTLLSLLKSQADSQEMVIDQDTLQYKIINSEPRLSADKKQAVVTINGSVQAATLLNASISDAAKSVLGAQDTNGFKYEINFASSTVDISKSATDTQMTATGDVEVKASINKDELAKALENKGKRDALALLQQTKGVTYAQIKIFPFWKTILSKASRITILVQD